MKKILFTITTLAIAAIATVAVAASPASAADTTFDAEFDFSYTGPAQTAGTVDYRPVPGSNAGCTAAGTNALTFGSNSATSADKTLVDTPDGTSVNCVYDVKLTVADDDLAIGGVYTQYGQWKVSAANNEIDYTFYLSVDEISHVWTQIKDKVVEYLPAVLAFLGSFLGIVIVIMLIRRGVRRMTGMVTSVGTG